MQACGNVVGEGRYFGPYDTVSHWKKCLWQCATLVVLNLIDKIFAICQDALFPSHFVYFSSLLDGSGFPRLFPSPAVKPILLAHAAHKTEMVCPSAAGHMEIFGPQQCHPKCILLLDLQQREQSSVEQPSVHGQKKHEEHTDMGFKWNSWLKNPHLLTTPLGPGAVCGMQCKILLMNTSIKPISGLSGKKTGPILLKPLCLHMELGGFGPW